MHHVLKSRPEGVLLLKWNPFKHARMSFALYSLHVHMKLIQISLSSHSFAVSISYKQKSLEENLEHNWKVNKIIVGEARRVVHPARNCLSAWQLWTRRRWLFHRCWHPLDQIFHPVFQVLWYLQEGNPLAKPVQ